MTSRSAATSRWTDRFMSVNGWLIYGFLYLPIVMVVVFSFSASAERWYLGRLFAAVVREDV